jgi:hypothetical protein
MMEYKKVYEFEIFDEIKKGNTVYCLDRAAREVFVVNEMTVDDLVGVIKAENTEPKRFECWEEVEETEEKENA